MSLVEKALQKLQAGRRAPEPASRLGRSALGTPTVEPRAALPEVTAVEPAAHFDPSRYSSKVVQIDRDYLRSANMLPPAAQDAEIATQFRTIKRPLIRLASESTELDAAARHTVMVASALPGDGKTFTSMNLALSLALELDFTVLLIDADAPKPHLTSALRLENEPGLLDVLADPERNVEDVILATNVPRLHVMPAGTRSETATELIASARMAEVVARLGTLYRRGIVLFDSPPILLTSESRSLGAVVGQIVLVVRAGTTPQQAVKDAVAILGEGRRVSLVLNGADLEGATGYYYGYRYGYGYSHQPAPAAQTDQQ